MRGPCERSNKVQFSSYHGRMGYRLSAWWRLQYSYTASTVRQTVRNFVSCVSAGTERDVNRLLDGALSRLVDPSDLRDLLTTPCLPHPWFVQRDAGRGEARGSRKLCACALARGVVMFCSAVPYCNLTRVSRFQ